MEATEEINEDVKNTVIARLRAIPENALVSIGRPFQILSKEQMIKEVTDETEIGKEIMQMQIAYLRSFRKR